MENQNLSHNEGYLYQHYLGWQGTYIPQEIQESIPLALEDDPQTENLELEAADQIAAQTPSTENANVTTVESYPCMVEEYEQLNRQ